MCNALHCWWSQYEDDHHRTMLLSLSKSGRSDICSFAPIFLRCKLNVMYKNWFQIFAQWTKSGRTSYFEVWCLKFTNIDIEAKGELTPARSCNFDFEDQRIPKSEWGKPFGSWDSNIYSTEYIEGWWADWTICIRIYSTVVIVSWYAWPWLTAGCSCLANAWDLHLLGWLLVGPSDTTVSLLVKINVRLELPVSSPPPFSTEPTWWTRWQRLQEKKRNKKDPKRQMSVESLRRCESLSDIFFLANLLNANCEFDLICWMLMVSNPDGSLNNEVKTNWPERDVALVGEDTAEGKKDNSTP